MGIKRIGIASVALAGAAALAFSGTASAATATRAAATANYQLCGTVWDDEDGAKPWKEFGAPPSGAQGVAGVTISGTVGGTAITPLAGSTNPTDANGRFCLQANNTLADQVIGGADVVLYATPPAGWTNTSPSPWANASGPSISASTFLAHIQFPYQSARDFHFTVGN